MKIATQGGGIVEDYDGLLSTDFVIDEQWLVSRMESLTHPCQLVFDLVTTSLDSTGIVPNLYFSYGLPSSAARGQYYRTGR